jgi:hypothetical protein
MYKAINDSFKMNRILIIFAIYFLSSECVYGLGDTKITVERKKIVDNGGYIIRNPAVVSNAVDLVCTDGLKEN